MKLLPFLLLILMCAKSLLAQTVIDVQLPVKMGDDIGASSNDHSTYSWGQETNNLQGVNIFLASATTPYRPTIDFQQNNGRIAVNILGTGAYFVDVQFQYDNDPYITVYNGTGKESHGWEIPPSSFRTIGNHIFRVKYLLSSGVIFVREYNFRVIPDASKFYIDNVSSNNVYRNKIRLWEASNSQNHKPLLLVEGFDATNTRSSEFYRSVADQMITRLMANGFKVYILNFAFNAQDMRNNAAVVHSAVEYISQINGNVNIVLAGASMGGVICRYALAKDETQKRFVQSTNFLPVSEFLSFDSPHQGAVISPSLISYTLSQEPNNYTMNKTAFQQLVRNNPFSGANFEHQNFYNDLKSLYNDGYPTHCRNIGFAFSNASVSNPGLGQNWLMIDASVANWSVTGYTDVISEEMALPGSLLPIETGLMNDIRLYWGLVNVTTTKTSHNPTFILNNSALDRINGVSKFCVTFELQGTLNQEFHDVFPLQFTNSVVSILKPTEQLNIPALSSYNFTEHTSNVIRNTLDNYGSLFFMKNNPSGLSSTPGPYPQSNSNISVTTYSCEPVQVNCYSGSYLGIGDLSVNNSAQLIISSNSTLNLVAGSTLKVFDGSKLIIDEGAVLSLEPGVNIELDGPNAVIEVRGALNLAANAVFSFSGSGFIQWAKGSINPQITAGTNAKFQLEGSSLSHKLMELSNNTVLNFPASLEFEIKNGKVFCSPGSGINISGKSTLFNSWFAGTGGATQPFNGVTVSSTQLNDIRFNYFDYANIGLNLIQTGNPNMPTLTGNRYRWCVTGLRVHDKGAIINGSHFIENGRGVELSATSARVNITGSNFQENTYGVIIVGTNPSPIQILSSTFNWSGTHGDEVAISCESGNLEVRGNNIDGYRYGVMGSGYLRLACNTIMGAEIAIEALPGATLNMANEARNNISNNGTGIGLYEAWLKIHNGKNKLDENTDRSIWGYIREDIYAKETLTHKTGAFDYYKYTFSNNLLNDPIMFPATTTGTSTGFLINYWPDVTTCYQEYLLDPNNPGQAIVSFSDNSSYNEPLFFECNPCNFDYQTCGEASPPWYTELYAELSVETNPTSLIISTPRFLNIELKDAIRQAMGHLTFEYNDPQHDLLALAELKDILTYNYGSDKENIEELLGYVRHAMTQGLANAYTNGLLPVEYGVNPLPLSDYAEAILNELDALIDQDPGNFNQIGYYSIEKAQVYRLAGHYQLALDELNTTNASYAPNRDYWLCICTQEWDFLQGNIDIDQFIENTSQCDGLFQARKRRMRSTPREGIYQKPNLTQLVLIPNPTDGPFKVSVPISTEKAQIEIYTPQGSIVKIMEVPASTSSVMVENLHLLPGTYLVKYKGAEKQLNGKLVVIK